MCGTSAQDRCKIVAYIDMMISIIFALVIIPLFILMLVYMPEIVEFLVSLAFSPEEITPVVILSMWLLLLFSLYGLRLQCHLSMILYEGAKKRDFGKINRWMKYSVFFLILGIIGLGASFAFYFDLIMSVSILIGFTLRVFCICIVCDFRNELKRDENPPHVLGKVPSAIELQESQLNV